MSERDPIRLFDAASGADERVRRCLAAGRDELPTDGQLAALAARLGPLLGPGGGAPAGGATGGGAAGGGGATGLGGGAGAATAGSLLGKAAGVALLAAALAGGGLLYRAARRPEAAPAPVVATPATARPELTPEVVPRGVDPADVPPTPTAPDASAPVLPTPRGPGTPRPAGHADADAAAPTPPAADPDAELALVRAAQDALGAGEPGRALAQATEHARRFPGGTLAQEREVVAIDALARLGRGADARQRADAFLRRWPRSAHARRIEVLLARLPPP